MLCNALFAISVPTNMKCVLGLHLQVFHVLKAFLSVQNLHTVKVLTARGKKRAPFAEAPQLLKKGG